MSAPQFTPGPWSVEVHMLSEGEAVCVYGSRGMMLADYLSEPDAHLIAAAPQLFDAAYDAAKAFEILRRSVGDDTAVAKLIDPHLDLLETAIAKALAA